MTTEFSSRKRKCLCVFFRHRSQWKLSKQGQVRNVCHSQANLRLHIRYPGPCEIFFTKLQGNNISCRLLHAELHMFYHCSTWIRNMIKCEKSWGKVFWRWPLFQPNLANFEPVAEAPRLYHNRRVRKGRVFSWWRHQMETFSALLALCVGNSPVTGEFPAQRPVTRSFDVFFDLRLSHSWVNNREAVDLRRHRVHHDVTVMSNHIHSTVNNYWTQVQVVLYNITQWVYSGVGWLNAVPLSDKISRW